MRTDGHWRAAVVAAAIGVIAAAPEVAAKAGRYSFRTLEGEVVAVGERVGEGDLQVLSVDLVADRSPGERLTVLLGPTDACRDVGLEVEEGDRVRVRVLLGEEGEPVKAQKILNLSRNVMVRLRTMHDVPLWDAAGVWQGGPGRAYGKGHGGGHRGGGGGAGQGPRRPGPLGR